MSTFNHKYHTNIKQAHDFNCQNCIDSKSYESIHYHIDGCLDAVYEVTYR